MHNPFKSLEKNPAFQARTKKKAAAAKASQPATPTEPAADSSEDSLFLREVADVSPLHKGGRDIAMTAPAQRQPAPTAPPTFAQLLEQVEFDMEYSHEFITAQIKGLDAKVFRKLKSGEFSIEAHLDLHGLNADQAKIAVIDFLRRGYMEGKRCVLLIPGRGRNSPQGQGVLRQELTAWLTQAPLKRIVLAFTTALPKHGGSGAIYLLLRQIRKDRGRILWEDVFTDLEG